SLRIRATRAALWPGAMAPWHPARRTALIYRSAPGALSAFGQETGMQRTAPAARTIQNTQTERNSYIIPQYGCGCRTGPRDRRSRAVEERRAPEPCPAPGRPAAGSGIARYCL